MVVPLAFQPEPADHAAFLGVEPAAERDLGRLVIPCLRGDFLDCLDQAGCAFLGRLRRVENAADALPLPAEQGFHADQHAGEQKPFRIVRPDLGHGVARIGLTHPHQGAADGARPLLEGAQRLEISR